MFANKFTFHLRNAVIFMSVLTACARKDVSVPGTTADTLNPLGINVSSEFNYATTNNNVVDVTLLTNDNKPLVGVLVNIYDKPLDLGGKKLFTSLSDASGKVTGSINLPTYLQSVVVDPGFIGLMHNAVTKVESNKITCTLGGSTGYAGNVIPNARVAYPLHTDLRGGRMMTTPYVYLGKYNSGGKPDYLLPELDKISARTLSSINASLPETKPIPDFHPNYLSDNINTNLDIVETSEVWITFVHEGAGYQNALSFFTYPTGKQPTTVDEIKSLTIAFPNASLGGSGGELVSGHKVSLGKFEAGTSIGFCLIANGWNGDSKTVEQGLNKFYSIDALNPESNATKKRHTILLKDEEAHLVLAGFEDLNREKDSDEDFNDLIFYATSNPIKGIATEEILPISNTTDSDGDGVSDVYDAFPKDPIRAYITTYPSTKGYATIAFEDNWPNTGDYDMNDLVVDYRYTMIQDGKNRTVEMYASYVPRASGAAFKNGFGVQFPFAPSMVAGVKGSRVTDKNIVVLSANGVEADQSKAVIIPFDDIYAIMPTGDKSYINTQPGIPVVKADTINMFMGFTTPLTATQLGVAPFNPFLIADRTRGREVHLPGELPTDKANKALFNTMQDNTIPLKNRYYKTKMNLPFALSVPQRFDYPYEGKMITVTYLKFAEWAQSGGLTSPDWYQDLGDYRNSGFIYK